MNMEIVEVTKSRQKAIFDVKADEFEKALDEAFKICNEKVTLKGFRKGHAPRDVYEKNFGVESLYEEALNVILNARVKELVSNEEIVKKICGQFEPSIETKDFKRGIDFQVSLSFDIYPEFELPTYKGLEVSKPNYDVTDEDLNKELNNVLKAQATVAVKEEQVINTGDIAVFDFVGTVDGVEFEGGKAENYELTIGSGQFIPGFEDQMIGMKANEVKDVNVTFPENYQAKDLAGKPAVFKVTLHEVKEEKLPDLTDDYVKGLNLEGITTVEALKASKKEEIAKKKQTTERDRMVDSLVNNILDNTVVEIPGSLINDRVNEMKNQYEQQAKMYNIPFETYLSFMGMTKEKFEEGITTQAKRQTLFSLVMNKLIEAEKLAPTAEEIKERALKDVEASKMSVEKLLSERTSQYYSELAYNKVMDFILSNAKEI